MDAHQEERNELAEDEEKLQLALQEVTNDDDEWLDYDDDDDDEEDEALLIDLEAQSSFTGQSTSSGYVESGSRGHFMMIDEEDSRDVRQTPSINVPSQQKAESFTAEKTLALNQALQEILESRIESIQTALQINREKQLRLNDGTWADLESKKPGKGRTWGPFRAPFFKSNEADSFPPDNEDTIMKRRTNELHYDSMREHIHYNSSSKKILIQAVVEDAREALMKPTMNRLEVEIKKATELRHSVDEKADDVQVLHKRWKLLKRQQNEMMERKKVKMEDLELNEEEMNDVKEEMTKEEEEYNRRLQIQKQQDLIVTEIEDELGQMKRDTDNQILAQVDSSKVDWMKLSKAWFKDNTSWLDCQKAWDFMANPRVNVKPWHKKEEERLLELVEKYEGREWAAVAEELGTCRTPFHCFNHYQNKFNPDFRARPWTNDEDDKLNEAVKRVRETSHLFSWGKVSTLINCRSAVECRLRYNRIGSDRSSGRWTRAEDARLVMAVGTLGENWCKVSKFMENRTVTQCKQRYTHCLSPELNFFIFTYEEDKKLLQLRKKLGKQWVKIAMQFKGRTDTMVKGRYRIMEKWRKEVEWWDNLDDKSKNLLLGKNLTVSERKHFEGQWKTFYNRKLGIADKDYKMQEKDKEYGVDPDIIPPRPPIYLKYSKFRRGFMKRTQSSWSRRLDLHHHLLENLKKRCELERKEEKKSTPTDRRMAAIKKVLKNNRLKDEDFTEDERKMSEMMKSSLDDTASRARGKGIPQDRMNSMLAALNLHFLGESNINVSELIKSSQTTKASNLRAAAHHKKKINLRLRRILAKNKWIYARGRHAHLKTIPHDKRRTEEIERDGKEWDKFVPSLLMKRLGGDSFTVMNSIKQRISMAQRKKTQMYQFEEDEEYKSRILVQKRRLKEIKTLLHLSQGKRDKLERTVALKMASIKREFTRSYRLKRELADGVIEDGKKDANYVENIEKNNALRMEERVDETIPSSSRFPSSSSKSQPPSASLFCEKAKNMLGDVGETKAIEEGSDITFSNINFLPPSLSTLTALRSLLLHRQQLMKTAGSLYNPDHYKRKRKRQLHIILESDDEDIEKDEDNTVGQVREEGECKAKKMKIDRPTSIKAIEVVERDDDGANDQGKNCTGSWFKYPDKAPTYEEIYEDHSGIDEDLDKRGNLPSTSFAPYSSGKSPKLLNPQYKEQLGRWIENEEEEGLEIPQSKCGMTMESIPPSNYEVVFGPSTSYVSKFFKNHPDKILTNPIDNDCDKKKKRKASKEDDVEDVSIPLEMEEGEDNKLKNVVVVGLSGEKNKIVHYKANEIADNTAKITCQDKDKNKTVPCHQADEVASTKTMGNTCFDGVESISKSQSIVIDDDDNDKEGGFNANANNNAQAGTSRNAAQTAQGHSTEALSLLNNSNKPRDKFVMNLAPLMGKSELEKTMMMRRKNLVKVEEKRGVASMPYVMDRMIKRSSAMDDNVVVVGVDPTNGKLVHYKKGDPPPQLALLPATPAHGPSRPRMPEDMSEEEVKAKMATIRETDEYQRLLARFRAVFMWPVLMSTTKPGSEINLFEEEPPSPKPTPVKRSGGRPRKKRRGVGGVTVEKKEPKAGKASTSRQKIDYSKLLPKPERPKREGKTRHNYAANANLEKKPRSQRIRRKNGIPAWWKEAITEVMKKKRDIEEEGEDEIDISIDDDFVDKGDYSDDEWLAELKAEEAKKEAVERKREAKMRRNGMAGFSGGGGGGGGGGDDNKDDEEEDTA